MVPHRKVKINAAHETLRPALERGLGNAHAICFKDREITYSELNDSVNRIGNGLKAIGVALENRVLMMMHDSPDFIAAYLGTMKIGAVAVAINVKCSSEELLFAIQDTRCVCVILDEEFLPLYEKIFPLLGTRPRLLLSRCRNGVENTLQHCLDNQPAELEPALMDPDDMAFWVYTSGTTGVPKAVIHLQHDVLGADIYLSRVLGLRQGDRLFATSKLYFAYALGNCLFGSFRLGLTTILHDAWPTPEAVIDIIGRHHPTVLFSVPVFYRNLLQSAAATPGNLHGVRVYVSAGERLPVPVAQRWRAMTGASITEGYGNSECIFMALSNRPDNARPGSAGQVCPDAEVRLVDVDTEEVISQPGKSGVLWIAMPSLCDRYWNQQARSNEVFRGKWFCTGDRFMFDQDGFYFHQGRVDDMLKISGQWVSASEIEDSIQDADVMEAAVVNMPDDDGLDQLALFIAARNPDVDKKALTQKITIQLQSKLAKYKCPRKIYFIDHLPRTANGKLQRHKLQEPRSD